MDVREWRARIRTGGLLQMALRKLDTRAGFLTFALAVVAVTATREARADLWRDLAKELKETAVNDSRHAISGVLDSVTPGAARRAALGLPGEEGPVTATLVGRALKDTARYVES